MSTDILRKQTHWKKRGCQERIRVHGDIVKFDENQSRVFRGNGNSNGKVQQKERVGGIISESTGKTTSLSLN